jgi:riboflavin kinase/FMN adenylyltransferase
MQEVVFTFDMPLATFFGNMAQKELTTKEEKRRIFEEVGIDVLIEFPINQETATISPEDFVEKTGRELGGG